VSTRARDKRETREREERERERRGARDKREARRARERREREERDQIKDAKLDKTVLDKVCQQRHQVLQHLGHIHQQVAYLFEQQFHGRLDV